MTNGSDHPQRQAWVEFGASLQRFRKGTSLQKLASCERNQGRDSVSRAQLSRYERGEILPKIWRAKHLDLLYEADGWVEMTLANLWDKRWDPWRHTPTAPAKSYVHRWPPDYSGPVWIRLAPTASSVGKEHQVILTWGPWTALVNTSLPQDGIYLTTGKAKDDETSTAVAIETTCDQPVFALFGSGTPDGTAEIIDIRQNWIHKILTQLF